MASLFAAAKRFVSYVTGAGEDDEETEERAVRGASSSSSARRRERSSGGSGSGGAEAARAKRAHLEKKNPIQPLLIDAPLGTGGVQGSRALDAAQRRDSDGDLAHAFFDAEALRWKEARKGGDENSTAAAAAASASSGEGARRPK